MISFWPQVQSQADGTGFFVPQLGQKFEVIPAWPHWGQSQPVTGWGFLAPQLGQKLDVIPVCPQAQFQMSPEAALPTPWPI